MRRLRSSARVLWRRGMVRPVLATVPRAAAVVVTGAVGAHSASNGKVRPEWNRLLGDITAGEIDPLDAYRAIPKPIGGHRGCRYRTVCLETATSRDHVIPLSRGRMQSLSNLQPAHQPCNETNETKGSNTIDELKSS